MIIYISAIIYLTIYVFLLFGIFDLDVEGLFEIRKEGLLFEDADSCLHSLVASLHKIRKRNRNPDVR